MYCILNKYYMLFYSPLAAVLDDKRATIVTKYLTSGRALSKSFDMYLQQVSI